MFLVYSSEGPRDYAGARTIRPYSRRVWEFQFIVKGKCLRLNRDNYVTRETPLTRPAICVSGPESVHGWSAETKNSCSILVFHFDDVGHHLKRLIGRRESRCLPFPGRELPRLRALYHRCVEAKRHPGVASLMIDHITGLELTLFFLGLIPPGELTAGIDFEAKKVLEALAWYRANLAWGPKIQEVAKAVHVSPTHLRRLFHKTRGVSPQEALTEVQFERARELMQDFDLPIERIGENAGFGSASAFSRAFRLTYGLSPRAYRDKLAG